MDAPIEEKNHPLKSTTVIKKTFIWWLRAFFGQSLEFDRKLQNIVIFSMEMNLIDFILWPPHSPTNFQYFNKKKISKVLRTSDFFVVALFAIKIHKDLNYITHIKITELALLARMFEKRPDLERYIVYAQILNRISWHLS